MSRLCAGPIKIAKYENTQKITIDAKFYKYGMYKHENLASLLTYIQYSSSCSLASTAQAARSRVQLA